MGTPLSLGDLTLIVVLFVTLIAGFFLIRALNHFGGILAAIKKTLNSNSENINSIIKDIPKITEKAAEISVDAQVIIAALKEEQKVLDVAINDVGKTISAISSTAQTINEDLLSKIKAVFSALAFLVNSIMKKTDSKDDDQGEADSQDSNISKKEIKSGNKKRKRMKGKKSSIAADS